MKNYTITVNGNVYDVTVEENGAGAPAAAPVAAPRAAAPAAPAAAPRRRFLATINVLLFHHSFQKNGFAPFPHKVRRLRQS